MILLIVIPAAVLILGTLLFHGIGRYRIWRQRRNDVHYIAGFDDGRMLARRDMQREGENL